MIDRPEDIIPALEDLLTIYRAVRADPDRLSLSTAGDEVVVQHPALRNIDDRARDIKRRAIELGFPLDTILEHLRSFGADVEL